ncbi:MAG TPA: thiamine phosphate synthase [Thermoanaerobaculia bacterium]
MPVRLPRIYAITDRASAGGAASTAHADRAAHANIAERLFRVGIRCVQVREKDCADSDLLREVEKVALLGREAGARVLVNDRVDVARLAAVGVHLGEDDLPASAARAILPPESVVGVSTHDPDAAQRAFADANADYVAFGPIYASPTKGIRPAAGLEALSRIAERKTKPLVAIGGLTAERLPAVFAAGADSAAMISGLLEGGRIEENARRALDAARRTGLLGAARLFLVGFMGSGKTAVGRRVAERLGVAFVDLDEEIERASGRTIRALFEESGEAAFRVRESEYLAGTASLPRAVVATGGGSFCFEANRAAIARLGVSVALLPPLAAVQARLSGKTDRPLFQSPEQLARLFAERAPFYRMASVQVNLSGAETIEEASDRVLVALEGLERFPS